MGKAEVKSRRQNQGQVSTIKIWVYQMLIVDSGENPVLSLKSILRSPTK
jgi:hypothetical protein